AHEGQGLGQKFLRHVERTRVLVHLVDLAPIEEDSSVEEHFQTILDEITSFGHGVGEKPRITVFSKADLVPDPEERALQINAALGVDGYPVSAMTGLNMDRLLEDCWQALASDRE
ncbi:MAG: GTPase ObgE, partial [Planctomycetes bacterium]|nr:GTPase ObgE [Planctomycetota bacterium]